MVNINNVISENHVCNKKTLIYLLAIAGIVILLVTALLIVFFTTWKHELHDDFETWEYSNQANWPGICKSGTYQSPIGLNQQFAYKYEIPPLKLDNFETCECLEVNNNGHTVTLRQTEDCSCQRPKLSGGGLNKNYTFDNVHFHWPSEHTVDGLSYDLEAHFVFYADKYKNLNEALRHPYGVAVLAVLYLETNYTKNNNFRIIADAVKVVSTKTNSVSTTWEAINFQNFLPDDYNIFFTYDGSLTTPACNEHVTWIVLKDHSLISYLDLQDITHVYDHNHELIVSNNRKLQDINDRMIYIRHNTI